MDKKHSSKVNTVLMGLALVLIASCSHKLVKSKYTLEVDKEIPSPCNAKETLYSIPLEKPDTIRTKILDRDKCVFVFLSNCGNEFEVNSDLNPKIFSQADPDSPPIKYDFPKCPAEPHFPGDTSDKPCWSNCRDRGNWNLDFGFSIGNRLLNDVVKETYVFYDKDGKEIVRNVPKDLLYMFDVAFHFSIENDDMFRLGLSSCLWIIDSIHFIPVSLSFKYITNPHPKPSEYPCEAYPFWHCWSFNVFVDLGLPMDFQTNAPIIAAEIKYQRITANLGIGVSLNLFSNVDFNLDIGARYIKVPLGELDCCPNIEESLKYPFRESILPYLKLGLSFLGN